MRFNISSVLLLISLFAVCFYLSTTSQRNPYRLENAIFVTSMMTVRIFSHINCNSIFMRFFMLILIVMLNYAALFLDINRQYSDFRSIWGARDWIMFWLMFTMMNLWFFIIEFWHYINKSDSKARLFLEILIVLPIWLILFDILMLDLSSFP